MKPKRRPTTIEPTYGRQKVFFIGIKELTKNKKASRRKQDKVDADILSSLKKHKK